MAGKHVLVFGTTGEIGARIARGCVDAGHQVTGVSRGTNTRHRVNLDGVELLEFDKRDPSSYEAHLATREFDAVIDSTPAPEDVTAVFDRFADRIEHYFICSSTGTYVPLLYLPADEQHPWRDETEVNFFAQSERDAYALQLYEEHRFPVTIFRPTNIIGRGRVPLETWGGRSIRYFKLLQASETVEIPFTGNILVQSGHNEDLASAFVSGVSCGAEVSGEIFNISCKRAITLDRYVGVAKEVLKSNSQVDTLSIDEILERRGDDASYGGLRFLIEHMCFDMSKAERMLGYAPCYTAEQGLEDALVWCMDEGLI